MCSTGKFNPEKYITKIKKTERGQTVYKDYLEVKYRIHWFRLENPKADIKTEIIQLDLNKGIAVVKATIIDAEGKELSNAHSIEEYKNFQDYLEKAETSAAGRALAMIGYGTLQGLEFDEGKFCDNPVTSNENENGNSKNGNGNSNGSYNKNSNGNGNGNSNGNGNTKPPINRFSEYSK